MHKDNLLDQLSPELLPFILKNLSIQDLYNCNSINNTWKKEVSLEVNKRPREEYLKYRNLVFFELYLQPVGYYQTAEKMLDACRRNGYEFTLAEVEDWLQFINRICHPRPKIVRPSRFRPIRSSDHQLGRIC